MKRQVQILEREVNGKPAFICLCHFLDKHIPDQAGFRFNYNSPTQFERVWFTYNAEIAARLVRYAYGDVRKKLDSVVPLATGAGRLTYDVEHRLFIWVGDKSSRVLPQDAGFIFDRDNGSRWITADVITAGRLVKYADESCRSQLFAAVHEAEEAQRASRATDADIAIPAPEGLTYLGYQKGAVAAAAKRFKGKRDKYPGLLLADEMGLGKTIEFIGMLNYFAKQRGKTLIIPPAGLKVNWLRELQKWLVDDAKIIMMTSTTPGWKVDLADIVIVNYDVLRSIVEWEWGLYTKKGEKRKNKLLVIKGLGRLDQPWDFIGCDEAHLLKNKSAQRTRFTHALIDRAKRPVFMTGSPIVNFPIELFPLLNMLDPVSWPNWFRFAQRYAGAHINQASGMLDTRGGTNLTELQTKLRSTGLMIRRLKADVLTELPPKRRQVIEIDPGQDAAARAAIQAEIALAGELGWTDNDEGFAEVVRALDTDESELSFNQMSLVRHQIGRATLPYGIAHLKAIWEEVPDKKIVVWGWHHDVLQGLVGAFKGVSVLISGKVSSRVRLVEGIETSDRMKLVDRFNNEPDCILSACQIQAAGVGLNMTVSAHHVFIEEDFRPSFLTQAEDRSHRIGQLESLLVQHIVLQGSFTARMIQRTVAKQEVITEALGDNFRI